MNTKKEKTGVDMRAKLSALWIFLLFNYIYGDIYTLMYPDDLKAIMSGYAGSIRISQGFLLQAAIFIEIAIGMVLLSRLLSYKVNRRVNIIAGVINIASVIASMFVGTPPTLHYYFFGLIELLSLFVIVGLSWRWKFEES